MKYTIKGQITITVKIESFNLLIKVSDTGVGISEEKLNTLFDVFTKN